jgi:Xaa-Pro aminopeptidase
MSERLDTSAEPAAARMRRDAAEIAAITAVAELASTGQEAVRASAAAGASEEELWRLAQAAIGAAVAELRSAVQPGADPGSRPDPELELLCDLLAGERSAMIDGAPGAATLAPGDPLLFDLAPRFGGYWADSCATFVVGRPSAALRARHDSVRAALDAGIAAARPGVAAGEVDAAVRGRLEADGLSCPHHSGHGVGRAAQEPPFLVPGDPTPLEEGMTIAIEPGAYGEGFGVRLEHLVLIEADGARPLTTHLLTLT